MEGASLSIVRCADGKLYTGLTRREVEERVSEHSQGLSAFTRRRRPVTLIFCEHDPQITAAIEAERRIKGWTRAKKLAYAAGDFELLWSCRGGGDDRALGGRGQRARGSRRRCAAPHHEARGGGWPTRGAGTLA